MATDIDLNLDSLKIPNVTGTNVVADYGTKTTDVNTYLTAQQAIDNLQLPFLRARSVYPARDTAYSVKNVRYNATLVFETPTADFTVDLPAGASNGHILHIVNKSNYNMTFTGATTGLDDADKSVPSGMATVLYQTSSGWMRISAGSLAHVVGTLPVNHGGTGRATLTTNAVIAGNGTNAVNQIATASGALYATSANGVSKFGTLPVAQGGTGLTASPSLLVNLASTAAANVMAASPRPGVTGTLPIAQGGTGVTANPSMLTNLGSTTAANVFAASPRPGVTGTLPVSNGGTGAATHAANSILTGNAGNALKHVATANGAFYATAANGAPTFGTLPVPQGGTGMVDSSYKNAVVIGNASDKTKAFQTVRVDSGAFYANAQDGSPAFGTLPVAQGGTGAATHAANSVIVGNGENALKHISSNNGAFYASGASTEPTFGTLPIGQGGTGKTTAAEALAALGGAKESHTHSAADINSGTLGIARGGTGADSFSVGLVEKATAQATGLSTRSVVTTIGSSTTSTSIPTEGAVRTELNKKISVSISGSTLVFS